MRSPRAATLWLAIFVLTATVGAACADVEEGRDGRYPAWIVGIDVGRRTVTIDEIEWLSGEEAASAWRRDNPAEPAGDGPPNDYYIVDTDERARTLAVAPDVDVTLVRLAEDGDANLDPGTFEELPAYFRSEQAAGGSRTRLWSNPFWFTVRSGTVVGIQEQYRP